MKFQQAAVYTSNSNLSRVERSGFPAKRVQSSYIRNKSKLSGVFQENLVPENSVCSKILIKEKILCCPENSNSAYNNLCFEDCPNLIILKKLEKDLKDLIESNLNLKKMNEYLLKTISIKDDLFIDVTKEVKNLKVDNNILNAHIGSKRILSGRQCQIRQSFKNSLASGFTDMQKPSSCSFNPKFASQSIISSSTLKNFYSGNGNFINKNKENYKRNFISNIDSISGSAIKKKRSDSCSNSKEVHVRGVSGFSRTNNLNTFLNLASQQKRKNLEARSNNNINSTNKKGAVVEFVNDINREFCALCLTKTNLNLNNNYNYNVNNSNSNNNLNQYYNSSSKVNLNLKNNEDQKSDVANSNRNNNNNQGFSVLATARFSPGSLTRKQTSLDLSPNKPQNSASSNTSDLNNENQNDNLNNNNNNNNNDNNNYFKSINNNYSSSKKKMSSFNQNQNNNNALRKQSYYNSDNYNNINITSSGANSSFAGHTKQNNFYDQISNLVSKNNQKNLKFKNKARSSLLGLNDEMLSKIITNEVISNLKKITLNDEEFIDFFRTTGEDKLISYCDAIYQLIRDLESAIKLIQRMRDYIMITASLANCALIEEIAAFIIKDACKIMDCDRTSIFIYDNLSDMLVVHTGEGLNRNEIRVPKNLGIIGNVFLKGDIIRVDDAYSDSRFNKDFDRKSNYVTKTILAAPLKDSSGKPFGVIQSINKNNNAKFTDDDEELIHLFSLHISQIMKSAKTNDQNISYIAKLKMIITFKEDVLRIESLVDFSNCIEQAIMNIFSTQYSQILIFNELKNNLVKISKYEKSEKNKNIGIVGYVFEKKEYFGVNSCNGCEFYNNLVDIETGMSILTYPIINKGNVKAILQFSYNDKLIHFKKPKETDEQIIKYLLLDCEKWFVNNEENVKSFFGE